MSAVKIVSTVAVVRSAVRLALTHLPICSGHRSYLDAKRIICFVEIQCILFPIFPVHPIMSCVFILPYCLWKPAHRVRNIVRHRQRRGRQQRQHLQQGRKMTILLSSSPQVNRLSAKEIINRQGNGICPMEQAVTGIDILEQALEAVWDKCRKLNITM